MALRLTVQVLLVLQALLHEPGRELYGLELTTETGLLPGTAYPILLRLENEKLGDQPVGGCRSAGGEAAGPPLLPADGERGDAGERGPGGRAPAEERGAAGPGRGRRDGLMPRILPEIVPDSPSRARQRRVSLVTAVLVSTGIAVHSEFFGPVKPDAVSYLAVAFIFVANVGVVIFGWRAHDGFLVRPTRSVRLTRPFRFGQPFRHGGEGAAYGH